MPLLVDESTRRMARMLGANEDELNDVEEEGLASSFYDETGRPTTFVGLQSDDEREMQTQK